MICYYKLTLRHIQILPDISKISFIAKGSRSESWVVFHWRIFCCPSLCSVPIFFWLSLPWHFWRLQINYFVLCLLICICFMFPHYQIQILYFVRNITETMLCSYCIPIRWHSFFFFILITWMRWCLPCFCTVKLFFSCL